MKNLLIILVLIIGLTSCGSNDKTVDELRVIEIGHTQIEVLHLLGEPFKVELEVGYEVWKYRIENNSRFYDIFSITIKDKKVTKYTTY